MIRLLSAVVLAAIVLAVVSFLPPLATLVLAVLASALAFDEYADLAQALDARIPRVLCAATVTLGCIAVGSDSFPVDVVLLLSLVLIGSYVIGTAQPGPGALRDAAAALLPIVYIGLPFGALAAIRLIGGRDATLLLIATMIVSDSAQYYTGRLFGRRPLAPAISPKKTIEGAIGGLIFGSAAMVAGGRYVFPDTPTALMIGAAVTVVSVGMVGDLFESLLKRSAGVKDSSSVIPGHGGILDRIDSWLFAGPMYYIFTRYLQTL
ncbi:MAG TPA: phosphatidate cytidylyltransferase [Vicinamibacterales bacterium]|nr:phosphatidate cytidylyltransferase [Vicinamibacterales bacterium]